MMFGFTGIQKQVMIALCVYIGQMTVGYTLGWTAPVIPKLQDPEQSPLPEPITEAQMSFIGTAIFIGGFVGPYLSGYLANRMGRKLCFGLAGTVTFIAFVVLAAARSLIMIYISRVMLGFGVGVTTVIVLVYLGEIASTNIRGLLLTGLGIFHALGGLLAYCVGAFVRYSVTGYVGAILALIYCLGVLCIPESPLYYVLKDKEKTAKKVLDNLGRSEDLEDVKAMKDEHKRSAKDEWTKIFTVKSNRKALTITVILNILQQSSGVIAVVFFITTIFELAGSSVQPHIASIIVGMTQLFASVLAPSIVERVGRKILMLASTAFCSFSLAVLGVYFYLIEINHTAAENIKWLPLATLIIFFLSYDVGFSIIPGTLVGELFTSDVRSTGSAVTITAGWVFTFALTTAFGPLILAVGGHVTFWLFSGACAVAFIFTLVFVPETRMKSFLEIQDMLSK